MYAGNLVIYTEYTKIDKRTSLRDYRRVTRDEKVAPQQVRGDRAKGKALEPAPTNLRIVRQ